MTAVPIIVMHLLLEKMPRSMIGVVMMFQSQLGLLDLWLKFSGMSVQTMQVVKLSLNYIKDRSKFTFGQFKLDDPIQCLVSKLVHFKACVLIE